MRRARKRVGRLEARVKQILARLQVVEDDLDCDVDGSIAQALGELRDEMADLRAVVEEWAPRARDDEARREAA